MRYGLDIYVCEYRSGSFHCAEKIFDTLSEAEAYYNQFDGKEFYDKKALDDEIAEIVYVVSITLEENGNYTKFIKGKYKPLDLEDFYPDFWELYHKLLSEKGTRFNV